MKFCENCPYPEIPECIGKNIKSRKRYRKRLQSQIEDTLKELYEKDYYLIEAEVNEVCITAHFWKYFFDKFKDEYGELDIDIEYNRNGEHPKYYWDESGDRHYAKPDMIIHKRGCNKHNFAYIEFKGEWNKQEAGNINDEEKLKAFTSKKRICEYEGILYAYRYSYGISIRLFSHKAELKWFVDGRYIKKYDSTWPRKTDEE